MFKYSPKNNSPEDIDTNKGYNIYLGFRHVVEILNIYVNTEVYSFRIYLD